ncbi:MAG: uroporphyrinogen-III synthase [Burkholderiales bacterium]|nr:uroporphyrinogen-III synthase [Burkholderiales bacterium]
MREIILMRPNSSSRTLRDELVAQGYDPKHIHIWPAFSIELPSNPAYEVDRLTRAAKQGAVIVVVSPSAVICLSKLNVPWPDDVQFAAPGESTAKEIAKAFHPKKPVIYPPGSVQESGSEALLNLFIKQGIPSKVVIARGQSGRELLSDELKKRGCEVEIAIVYYRIPLMLPESQKEFLNTETKAVIYITSTDAFKVLMDNLGNNLKIVAVTAFWVTIHPRIKEKLLDQGMSEVHLVNPRDPQLAEILFSLGNR